MRRAVLTTLLLLPVVGFAEGPAFNCRKAQDEVQALVCGNPDLAALDRELDEVYRAALSKARKEKSTLRGEQDAWLAGRDGCARDRAAMESCVRRRYQTRIGELQALYELVPSKGPYTFDCGADPADSIVVKYFHTDPPIARLQRAGQTVIAWSEPGAKGSRFAGENVSFLNKGVRAQVDWLGRQLACEVRTPPATR